MNGERPSGTFKTMAVKMTDSTWKRWTMIAGAIAAIGAAAKVAAPIVAPMFGLVLESDLKWRTEKILKVEQAVTAKDFQIAVMELKITGLEKELDELKREVRGH